MKKIELEDHIKTTEKTLDYSVNVGETTQYKLELISQFFKEYAGKLSGYNCAGNPVVITASDDYYGTISFVMPITDKEKDAVVKRVIELYPNAA